jgi:hypothetical protein
MACDGAPNNESKGADIHAGTEEEDDEFSAFPEQRSAIRPASYQRAIAPPSAELVSFMGIQDKTNSS